MDYANRGAWLLVRRAHELNTSLYRIAKDIDLPSLNYLSRLVKDGTVPKLELALALFHHEVGIPVEAWTEPAPDEAPVPVADDGNSNGEDAA